MKKLLATTAGILLIGRLAMSADIVIPEDTTPFKVQFADVVRIPANGIAGTQVKAKVTGSATATVNSISTRVNGRMPIGSGNHEVEVKASKKGKVTVEVTITPPNASKKTETYEYEVE